MMYGGWMWENGWGWAGWILICVVTVLFSAAVITAIVLAIRYAGGSRNSASGPPDQGPSRPEDILAQRFALGEIDEDDYRRRVTLLHEYR